MITIPLLRLRRERDRLRAALHHPAQSRRPRPSGWSPPWWRWRASSCCSAPQFVAIIQILVYAGAVMVLFLFVIMLLNLDKAPSDLRGPGAWIAGTVMGASLLTELMVLRRYSPERLALEFTRTPLLTDPIGGLPRRRGRQRGHGPAGSGGRRRAAALRPMAGALRTDLGPAAGRDGRRRRPRQAEGLTMLLGPALLVSAMLFAIGVARRAGAPERPGALHVHRADAQCGEPVVRGALPRSTVSAARSSFSS